MASKTAGTGVCDCGHEPTKLSFAGNGRQVFAHCLEQAWASSGFNSRYQAPAQFLPGRYASQGFDGPWSLALFALNHAQKKLDRLRQSGERDSAEQNTAKPLVREVLLAAKQGGERGEAARFGQRKGGFARGIVTGFEEAGHKGDGRVAFNGQQRGEALAEDFRLLWRLSVDHGAEAQHRDRALAQLRKGTHGLEAHGLVFVN